MRDFFRGLILGAMLLGLTTSAASLADAGAKPKKKNNKGKKVDSPLAFTVKNIKNEDVDLSKYKGKVVLIVNVASECGLTPQYKDLQALHQKYADSGLAVLGFPANEFGAQEPGTNEEIAKFCKNEYSVTFDMFAKVVVKGKGQCELYRYLTGKDSNSQFAGPISWNFEKFLLGRDGKVVARFQPGDNPSSAMVVKAIETELAKK